LIIPSIVLNRILDYPIKVDWSDDEEEADEPSPPPPPPPPPPCPPPPPPPPGLGKTFI